MSRPVAAAIFAATVFIAIALAGCASQPRGAAAQLTEDQARAAMDQMHADHRASQRPIVILNGYRAPSVFASSLRHDIIDATSGDETNVALIAYPWVGDIDRCAREAVEETQKHWPSADPAATVEVDAVGISMGGLVARWAALSPAERREIRTRIGEPEAPDFPRLRVARLFTFATPHAGASMAGLGLSHAARDMEPDSPFLAALNGMPRPEYPIVAYAHLGDGMVGARRAAPQDQDLIWSSGTLFLSHYMTHRDPIFIADVLRRLRDEPPLLRPDGPPPSD